MQLNQNNHEDGQFNNIVDNLEFQSVLDIYNLNDDQFQEQIPEQNSKVLERNNEQEHPLNLNTYQIHKNCEQLPQPDLEGEFIKLVLIFWKLILHIIVLYNQKDLLITRTREQSKQIDLINIIIHLVIRWIIKQYYEYRHERILDPQILNQTQTGDLLIFRTKGTLQNLQRSITRRDYDHIVIFLKNLWKDPMLFESSNQYGVISFSFKCFVGAK